MRPRTVLFVFVLLMLVGCPLGSRGAFAAPQIIEAEGVYVMGDSDAPKDARDAARKEAMRAAVEQAGVYVESYTEAKNLTLTKDEVRTVAGTILRIIKEEAVPETVRGAWQYRVRLTCEVDTEEVDVESLAHKKEEIARLERERDALKAQNSALRIREQVAKNAAAATHGTRLEDTLPYTAIFDETARLIEAGQPAEAVQEISRLIGDPRVTGDALAYAHVLRGRAYYEMGDDENAVRSLAAADDVTRESTVYPLWRSDQYYGLICERHKKYKWAAQFLRRAWEASDKTDTALSAQLERVEKRVKKQGGGGNIIGNVIGGIFRGLGAIVGIG
ncbi:hypothetical protein [Selenomonas sp. F0473]|uniref:hypothetical protein n=1 Tax=Selenomonas sp. F0473 TaxID=999423 RepID=UPI00029E6022|nr:hypothetical protein [Selenomonas sp. F0473]EKU71230.1 hypothetical protein HMPREF9161_01324 [Selenomonas sp. F0473]